LSKLSSPKANHCGTAPHRAKCRAGVVQPSFHWERKIGFTALAVRSASNPAFEPNRTLQKGEDGVGAYARRQRCEYQANRAVRATSAFPFRQPARAASYWPTLNYRTALNRHATSKIFSSAPPYTPSHRTIFCRCQSKGSLLETLQITRLASAFAKGHALLSPAVALVERTMLYRAKLQNQ
jgi:hypothetical protein